MKELVYIIGLLSTLAALILHRRKEALLFLISFYFVFTVGWIFYRFTGIFMYDMPILALFFYGLIQGKRFQFYLRGVSLVFILFLIWMLVTAIPAQNPGWALAEFSKFLRGYIVFVCFANLVRTRRDYQVILLGLGSGLVLEFILAVWQWRIGMPPLGFLNLSYHRWRATGTFYVPHYLGNYLVLLLPIFIRLAMFYRARTRRENIKYAILSGCGLLTFLVSLARGPWVAFGTSMAIMFILSMGQNKLKPRIRWTFSVFLALGGIFLLHYLSTIQAQFGDDRKDAFDVRFDQIRVSRRIIADRFLLGTGMGNYHLVSYDYLTSTERQEWRARQYAYMVHNSYLYITAEMGVPGGILFILTLLKFFYIGLRGIRTNDLFSINLIVGIMTGLLGICVAFMAGPDIRSEQLIVQMYMGGGIMYSLLPSKKSSRHTVTRRL
ncbi:MAG TPA: O-antigen ligase domain-containing protein [bacterium]|nr:O-antigen ligase domain-containing protein [bacterium]